MKFVVLAMIGVLSFAGAFGAALWATGMLSSEGLKKAGETQESVQKTAVAEAGDPLSALAQQLKKKENDLKEREAQLQQRDAQVVQREQELVQMQKKLEDLQKQILGGLDDAKKERQTRLETIATTVSAMKPDKAAEQLENLPPEDAAAILNLVKPKERGKIVEAMKTEAATRILRILQEPTI
ncbi:MAG TPA: hypothetical protein PLI09_11345 [Candidatus Hydrogenedentes bacterium]|nr:hypothetical protein [Candidatus Hydrogenedentota bacterium]